MKDIDPFLKAAIKEAEKSECKQRHGCIIFHKKTIIAKGRNYIQKSVRSFNQKFIKYERSIHAEVCAIINARRDLKNCNLLVIRLNNIDDGLTLSKPCDYCIGYIKHVGIKYIFYSNKKGEIVYERV